MISRSISFFSRGGNGCRVLAALALAALTQACASAPPPPPVVVPPPPPVAEAPAPAPIRPDRAPAADSGLTPPHMQGRSILRAALLLPFSNSNEAVRREAEGMLNAAELALFERGGDQMLLIPKDDGGTRAGAEAAARAALAEGADVILGPLLAQAVTGAAAAAGPAGVPVVAFSTDIAVAGNGVYLLSFTPGPEVRRATAYAAARGARAIALLAADNALGRRVAEVLRQQAAEGGLPVYDTVFYPPNAYDQATLLIEQLAAARASGGFDALYISDSVASLRELATVLDVNMLTGQSMILLGPDSWRADPALGTVPALRGAFVAGADQTDRSSFVSAYRGAYNSAPSNLASLAYDAVALASQLRGDVGDWDILENPNGYVGADGLFRLAPDGVAERGLAIYQIGPTGAAMVEPAPSRFDVQLAF